MSCRSVRVYGHLPGCALTADLDRGHKHPELRMGSRTSSRCEENHTNPAGLACLLNRWRSLDHSKQLKPSKYCTYSPRDAITHCLRATCVSYYKRPWIWVQQTLGSFTVGTAHIQINFDLGFCFATSDAITSASRLSLSGVPQAWVATE